MAYNTCSGNAFGPPQHTLFLGCSISSFHVSAGWNEQVGELTVRLVEDTCSSATGKVYWDVNLVKQTGYGPDPGFLSPNIGSACYFRVGDFEWCGLLQSYEIDSATDGNPVYVVKLGDPRQILEGAKMILSDYSDSVYNVPNIFNVYGYAESFGTASSTEEINGATFGSPAGGFGGSKSNDNGMPWYIIKDALNNLTSRIPIQSNKWSPKGRLEFRDSYGVSGGIPDNYGYGIMNTDGGTSQYLLDLSSIPPAPTYWKLNDTSMSIMDAISQICSDAVCDYYVELVPAILNGYVYKVIKIRTVSRYLQPTLGAIGAFIGDNNNFAMSYTSGVEMRNETTEAFIIGGKQQDIYQAYQSDPILGNSSDVITPFFGVDPFTKNVIESTTGTHGYWQFTISTLDLNRQMMIPLSGNTLTINELELLSAKAGFTVWEEDTKFNQTDSYFNLYNREYSDYLTQSEINELASNYGTGSAVVIDAVKSLINHKVLRQYENLGLIDINIPPLDLMNMSLEGWKYVDDILEEDTKLVYNFVLSLAENYYGKQFMVRLPYTTASQDIENLTIQTTEEVSDGGWTDHTDILGLSHPSVETDFFALDDNRTGPIMSFDIPDTGRFNASGVSALGGLDPNSLNPGSMFVAFNVVGKENLYLPCSISSNIEYVDRSTLYSPRVIVSIDSPILERTISSAIETGNHPDGAGGAREGGGRTSLASKKAYIAQKVREQYDSIYGPSGDMNLLIKITANAGGISYWTAAQTRPLLPAAVAIPLRSTVQTYGPWYNYGLPGIAHVVQDDSLVPWEYATTARMNEAGYALAFEENASAMQVGELGNITVPGYPVIPLGAELGAYGLGFYGGGTNLVEGRSFSEIESTISNSNVFVVPVNQLDTSTDWTGLYGPNITSISVEVSTNQITTNYQMRTFTPSFGRFSRNNAERIKSHGQKVLAIQKKLRQRELGGRVLGHIASRRAVVGQTRYDGFKNTDIDNAIRKNKKETTNTPTEIFIGQHYSWCSGTSRSMSALYPAIDAGKEFQGCYNKKAFMSMDGLFRPVSMFGDAGLPRFAIPLTGLQNTVSPGGIGPLILPTGMTSGIEVTGYQTIINSHYLNPLNSHLINSGAYIYGNASGHDIAILGFGDRPPGVDSDLNMYAAGGGIPQYQSDYRFFAHKGPMMMHGWGFDLDGKPIPNKADTDIAASGGIFTPTGLHDKFLDNWMTKSHTWPLGPIDLRWDRNRSVWTIPQTRMVIGQVVGDMGSGMFSGDRKCQLVFGDDLFGPTGQILVPQSGNDVSGVAPYFPLKNHFGMSYSSGSLVLGYYEPQKNEYYGLIPQRTTIAVLDEDLTFSGNALAYVWANVSGTFMQTQEKIMVYDWLLKASQTISSGTRCINFYEAGSHVHILQEARCP
jgi:hypothetical protein